MISRRSFLLSTAASVSACTKIAWLETTPHIDYPGMQAGHLLRDSAAMPAPSTQLNVNVLILGSGVAGLTAAWKMSKEGMHDFLLINGPETGGNTRGGHFGKLTYPTGAHYLPLPSMESTHVRELLADVGIIEAAAMSNKPRYDETCILHAPDERLLINGQWQEGLLPQQGISAAELTQHKRFFTYIASLKTLRGADGRKIFAVPIVLSSTDPHWTQLDTYTVRQWLNTNGYTAPSLHWYLNYVCRDEYGANYDRISAWCGLHYFASRAGQAANAQDGAILTWPDGLNTLLTRMHSAINIRCGQNTTWHRTGFAVNVKEHARGVHVLCAELTGSMLRTYQVNAKRVICAIPLHVATHVVNDIGQYGFDPTAHLPPHSSWLVSNFLLNGFPRESKGSELAWDNVVYGGRGLGYVVSTHQEIRVATPPQTVFSAYQALSDTSPEAARAWLAKATPDALYQEATCDLKLAYNRRRLLSHIKALDITVRAHAMASPTQGFLSNIGIKHLREIDGKLLFAHSDLSGYSVFEEAAWWGYRAALLACR